MELNVTITDAALNAAFANLNGKAANFLPATKRIGEYLQLRTDDHFREEKDPDGRPWVPLAKSTIAQKQAAGKITKILQRGGYLRASISYQAGPDSVQVGTPFIKGKWLQEGSKPYIIRPRAKKALSWVGANGRRFSRSIRHPGLAARPFLGVSKADVVEIKAIVADYLST